MPRSPASPSAPARNSEWALRERVKELTCLYGIAQAAQEDLPLDGRLARIAELLPGGWQYPAIAAARIVLDGRTRATPEFRDTPWRQQATIRVRGVPRGLVEVLYAEERPVQDEGPFLAEERSLLDEVARQVGLVIERAEDHEERHALQEQLRHADRLATLGQMAAGTAHELNEPLGGILGFAQLARRAPDLPAAVAQDLDRIVNASLYAREIIRKLLFFARQVPTRKEATDLNALVRDGLYLLESRCARDGVTIHRRLQEGMPPIVADPGQLHQVLVNLAVNAIQAMPGGGTLTISTRSAGNDAFLAVEDTGTGMTPEVRRQLFLPFFTTKDVGQGTGLGLAVVHGIVESHQGSIDVTTEVGKGSRFELRLPVHPGKEGHGP